MIQVLWRLQADERFDVVKINSQTVGQNGVDTFQYITEKIAHELKISLPLPADITQFEHLFTPAYLSKPLILILDEFDNLSEEVIGQIVQAFRNIYVRRRER